MNRFELFFTHSMFVVTVEGFENPFSIWTPAHVAQGFAWRDGAVSFGCLGDGGTLDVVVEQSEQPPTMTSDAKVGIEVPFRVPAGKRFEVASVTESQFVEMPTGLYQLRFEAFEWDSANESGRVNLFLWPCQSPRFGVPVAIESNAAVGELLTTAEPVD